MLCGDLLPLEALLAAHLHALWHVVLFSFQFLLLPFSQLPLLSAPHGASPLQAEPFLPPLSSFEWPVQLSASFLPSQPFSTLLSSSLLSPQLQADLGLFSILLR